MIPGLCVLALLNMGQAEPTAPLVWELRTSDDFATISVPPQEAERGDDGELWFPLPIHSSGCATLVTPAVPDGAASVEIRFQVEEAEPSEIQVRFGDRPGSDGSIARGLELALHFDPQIQGETWFLRRHGDGSKQTRLRGHEEPEGLDYRLQFRLIPGGGIEIREGDSPLAVLPAVPIDPRHLSIVAKGSIRKLAISGPHAIRSATELDTMQRLRAQAPVPIPSTEVLKREDEKLPPAAERFAHHDQLFARFVEPVATHSLATTQLHGVTVECLSVECVPRAETPCLVFRPATPAHHSVLIWSDDPAGHESEALLDLAMGLARVGAVAVLPDALGRGQRPRSQPHDGPYHQESLLTDLSLFEIQAWEIRRLWNGMTEWVDSTASRSAVGVGAGSTVLASVAPLLSDLQELVVVPDGAFDEFDNHLIRFPPAPWPGPNEISSLLEEFSGTAALLHPGGTPTSAVLPWFLEQWNRNTPLPAQGPDDSRELLAGLAESRDGLGTMWYSWVNDQLLWRADDIPPCQDVEAARNRLLSSEPVAPARVIDRWRSSSGSQEVVSLDCGSPQPLFGLIHHSSPERIGISAPESLVSTGVRSITVAFGDLGASEALDQAMDHWSARNGEVWIALDFQRSQIRTQPGELVRWVRELESVLQICPADPSLDLRLFGQGWGGLLALLVATSPDRPASQVAGCESLITLRSLLEVDRLAFRPSPPSPLVSERASPSWFVPGLLEHLEVEDLVLALEDADIPVDWIRPVDARRRPLGRRTLQGMWPRLQHRSPTWGRPAGKKSPGDREGHQDG